MQKEKKKRLKKKERKMIKGSSSLVFTFLRRASTRNHQMVYYPERALENTQQKTVSFIMAHGGRRQNEWKRYCS